MSGYFEHTYYNTYYYANIVDNILTGDPELLGFISNFFTPEDTIYHLARPFNKRSAFHLFIEHIVSDFFDEDMHKHDERDYEYCCINPDMKFTPYAEKVLEYYDINNGSFDSNDIRTYEDVENYHTALYESGILLELFEVVAKEIFYIMFNNRNALLRFNLIVAQHMDSVNFDDINDEEYTEAKKLFTKAGILKRSRIPEWSKKAVFFRDRGRCCLCHQDLSGTLSMNNKKHYDHIIPLAQGGLNDVANIQLVCSFCNAIKGAKEIKTSDLYERWF